MALSGLLRSTYLAFTLAVFAVLASLVFVLATPVVSTITTEGPGGSRVVESGYAVVPLLTVAIQLISLLVVGVSLVLIARGRRPLGRQVLLVGAIVGLIPAVVPGVLAFAAWFVFGKAYEIRQ
jgi:uncharacterized membrane protein YozB (DUF420 family)